MITPACKGPRLYFRSFIKKQIWSLTCQSQKSQRIVLFIDLAYRMLIDTTTPEGSVRAIVVPDNVPFISRTVQITKDEFICDRNIRIYAPVSTYTTIFNEYSWATKVKCVCVWELFNPFPQTTNLQQTNETWSSPTYRNCL